MPGQPLLKKLDEAIERIRFLERENDETLARAMNLENQSKELSRLIALAESKADEILKPAPPTPRTSAEEEATPKTGKGLQDLLEEASTRNLRDTKRR
jgi:hypothetical protein